MMTTKVRYAQLTDLPHLTAADNAMNSFIDPDFGVPQLLPCARTEDELKKLIGQRRNLNDGTFPTRSYVVEVRGPERTSIVGGAIVELMDDRLEVIQWAIHPEAPADAFVQLVSAIVERVNRSDSRPSLHLYIRDGLYEHLSQIQAEKWEVALVPNYFEGGHDAWECIYRTKKRPDAGKPAELAGV